MTDGGGWGRGVRKEHVAMEQFLFGPFNPVGLLVWEKGWTLVAIQWLEILSDNIFLTVEWQFTLDFYIKVVNRASIVTTALKNAGNYYLLAGLTMPSITNIDKSSIALNILFHCRYNNWWRIAPTYQTLLFSILSE